MNLTPPASEKKPYITVYRSIGGWKAVMYWWSPEGFWEPWQTGLGGYASKAEADEEAKLWAENEGVELAI